jgi:hypothetical protein
MKPLFKKAEESRPLSQEERGIIRYYRSNYRYGIAELTHVIIERRNRGLWDYIMGEVRGFVKEEDEEG